MIKSFELFKRNPALDREDFAEAWRTFDEDALRAAPTAPTRVVHCAGLKLGRSEPRYDGVSIMWHADEASRAAFFDCARADSSHAAPWEQIVDPSATIEMITDERIVRGDEWLADRWSTRADESVFMLLGFIERKHPMTIPQFRDYWWDEHRPLANRLIPVDAQANAYVQNRVFDDSSAPWDGVGELYLDSLDLLPARATFFDTDASAELVADEARFLEHATRLVLITDHQVIEPRA